MRDYVKECLQKHPPDEFPVEFVQCVFDGVRGRGKNVIKKNTKALVELSRKRPDDWIPMAHIRLCAGTEDSPRYTGLKLWRDTGVVENEGGIQRGAYRIKIPFYEALQILFASDESQPGPSSIMRLQGLGKEVWAGIDAQAYVDRERSAWAG